MRADGLANHSAGFSSKPAEVAPPWLRTAQALAPPNGNNKACILQALLFFLGIEPISEGIRRLWTHTIRRFEISAGVGNQLRVGRVVNRFDTNNLVSHLLIVTVYVLDEI